MAVKIPQYESQTNARGMLNIGGWASANPAPVSTAIGEGMQNFARSVQDFALQAKVIQDENAALEHTKWASDTRVFWTDNLQKRFNEAKDGAPDFSKNFMADLDAKTKERLESITDERQRIFAEKQIIGMREHFAAASLGMEREAQQAKKRTKLEGTIRNNEQLAYQGKITPQEAEKSALTATANSGLDPVTRAKNAQEYVDRINHAYIEGEIERNPDNVLKAAEAASGKVKYGAASNENSSTFLGAAKAAGLTNPHALAALGATGERESGWSSARVGATWSDSSKSGQAGTSGGALSWRGERLNNLRSFAAKKGEQGLGSMQTQAEFFMQENPALIQQLQGASSAREAMQLMNNAWKFAGYDKEGGESAARFAAAEVWATKGGAVQAGSGGGPVQVASIGNENLAYALGRSSPDRVQAYMRSARGEAQRQDVDFRVRTESTIADHAAMFANGVTVPQPLDRSAFQRMYGAGGAEKVDQKFREYEAARQLGSDIAQVKMLPAAEQARLLEESRPDAAKPDYALQQGRYQSLAKAVKTVNDQREADPVQWAIASRIGGAQPLQWNSPQSVGPALAARVGTAKTLNEVYNAPLRLMSEGEAATLSRVIAKTGADDRATILRSISQSIGDPDAYRAVMQQIAPDNPVFASVGRLLENDKMQIGAWALSNGRTVTAKSVADMLIEGDSLLNPPQASKESDGKGRHFAQFMPPEKDLRTAFLSIAGEAFQGSPQAADIAFQSIKAYYAAASARAGDLEGGLDSGRVKEAVESVIGGVNKNFGAKPIIMPWGMDEATFSVAATKQFSKVMQENGYASHWLNSSVYTYTPVGEGKYLLGNGTGTVKGNDGRPLIIDITDDVQAMKDKPRREQETLELFKRLPR